MANRPSIFDSARLIGACTFLSRILGMARDILCSHFFGAGFFWDAFAIAYRVPNLFRRLFGEGALSAAFVPAFVGRIEIGRRDEAFALLNRLLTVLILILGAATLIGIGITIPMSMLWPDEKTRLVAELLRILLPYCVLVCAGAIVGAALNGLFRFFAPAIAPAVLNLTWIAAILIFATRWSADAAIRAVAWAIIAGGLFQMLAMAIPLHREGARFRFQWEPRDPALREVAIRFIPGVFGLALVQINELVDSVIAELCVPGDGAVSSLYYGYQLTQLPLSLIGTSLATAAFPGLSAAAARRDRSEFSKLFRGSLTAAIYLSLPATVGLVLFARPIVELIFEHGRFTPEDTARAGTVLALYSAGLWCYIANQVQVRAFHAHGDTRTPVRVSASMVGLNLALNLILVWPFREAGIALSTSLSGLASFAILNRLLRRRYPEVDLRPVRRTFWLSAAAAAAMAAGAWAFWRWVVPLPAFLQGTKIWQEGTRLGLVIALSMLLYFGLTKLLGMPEAARLMRRKS
ncbi:MAG: murein biosynthesis integral membrane protein MurJ [Planctomycetes bacterium]|nr:murein biosynthesis integral membrane protein MurJ [Planctomycetota bacterium]